MEAVSLSNTELNSLNYTYSNAICKIFNVSHCSVEDILHFTQEPNINNCWLTRRTRLFQRGSFIGNHVVNFLCDLLCAVSRQKRVGQKRADKSAPTKARSGQMRADISARHRWTKNK